MSFSEAYHDDKRHKRGVWLKLFLVLIILTVIATAWVGLTGREKQVIEKTIDLAYTYLPFLGERELSTRGWPVYTSERFKFSIKHPDWYVWGEDPSYLASSPKHEAIPGIDLPQANNAWIKVRRHTCLSTDTEFKIRSDYTSINQSRQVIEKRFCIGDHELTFSLYSDGTKRKLYERQFELMARSFKTL